ncbi:MAG TPA: glycosyltransferase [Glaciihabitans sp.]|jgi:glycosyltransferase involved in cell wall biosynthesis|nr:glycosyltransferase [Glaciihabitans sp.]
MDNTPAQVIKVASIPGRHPYVHHISPLEHSPIRAHLDTVYRLPDPLPNADEPLRWWPPVMLDAQWVHNNAHSFDVMHLHFGAESYSVEHVERFLDALETERRPFVYTVHDLTNPQLMDQSSHIAQLDVLIPRADALITLTAASADEIQARWGRTAVVIDHPHMLPLHADIVSGDPSTSRVIGLHLRDLRPNIDAAIAVATLLSSVDALRANGRDVIARIDMNSTVRDESIRDTVRELCASNEFAELVEHPRYNDESLVASLAALDVAVLPYRHGTHSGWVELCWDLGVPVVGPQVGYAALQHNEPEFFATFEAGNSGSLVLAIERVLDAPLAVRSGSEERGSLQERRRKARLHERSVIAEAHVAVYRRALATFERGGESVGLTHGQAESEPIPSL